MKTSKSKHIITFIIINLFILSGVRSQDTTAYMFTHIKENPVTSIKNQYRSGTCWSFSGLSFFESELLRKGKGEYNLSEMFIVRTTYLEKAKKYVRMHANQNFGPGGAFNDVTSMWKKYGIVPEEVYPGLQYGEEKHVHGEIDASLKAYIDAIVENPNRKLSSSWLAGFEGLLDAYFGVFPEEFIFKGKSYTPQSFSKELDMNMDDYIMLSSFTHHPFYKPFILEVPDNWGWGEVYNVKIDELIDVINNAINIGSSVAWASDVSEKGFVWKKGLAIVPDEDFELLDGLERARWENMPVAERQNMFYDFNKMRKEKNISQELRQEAFDNYTTTDDHGMHISGIARDRQGNKYYIVKNSWSEEGNSFKGYLYASEAFVKFKTLSILVHKDSVTKELRKKLQL